MSSMGLDEQRLHLLALCGIPELSWYLVAREAQRPGGLGRLLQGEVSEKSDEASAARFVLRKHVGHLDLARARDEVTRAVDAGAKLTTVLDDDYPANLRVIFNLPPFLFYKGTLQPDDAYAVAVVGTRNPSPAGVKRARSMAKALAERSVTVLSGLARGIDTAAHEATLAAGGRTIAVMGTGILSVYPKENGDLAGRIAAQGAIVSQFWPTAPPSRYNFPRRNVVTSGLGQGTVVIEATKTSGAKMQARLALQHGKMVFLIKSLVTQKWAQDYLEKGAVEVSSVQDVVGSLRSPEQVEALTLQRRQLVLDLA